jgi:hypothetical protein
MVPYFFFEYSVVAFSMMQIFAVLDFGDLIHQDLSTRQKSMNISRRPLKAPFPLLNGTLCVASKLAESAGKKDPTTAPAAVPEAIINALEKICYFQNRRYRET